MSNFDFLTAALFTFLIVGLGMLFYKSGKDAKSFFAGGGSVPWWISSLSLFMSFFSVGTFVVWGSIAYSEGVVSITIQITMAISGLIVGFVIAPAWNKTKALTAAEFISNRLGQNTQKIYSVVFLLMNLFTAGAFLYPVGKIIEVSTGLPLDQAIIILGLLIIAYTTIGGLWAVLVTDVLQFVVLTAAVVILVPLSLGQVGGISGFLASMPEGFSQLQNEEYSWLFLLAFIFYNTVFIGGNWAYVQRYTSVSTPSNARKVGLLFGALYLIAPIVWMIPPMVYRVINPELSGNDAENAYLMISQEILPVGLLGLVFGSMIFATASSVNTTLNIASGVFSNDLVRSFKPNLDKNSLMLIARLSTFVFGVLAIFVALAVQDMGGIVKVVLSLAALTGAPLYLPPIWAMFSKRQTGRTILLTTVVSLGINLFFKFAAPQLFGITLSQSYEMLIGVLVPVAILIVFEIVLKFSLGDECQQHRNYQAYRMMKSSQDNSEDPEPAEHNSFGTKIIAFGVLTIGVAIALIGVFSHDSQRITIIVGSVICVASLFHFNPINSLVEKLSPGQSSIKKDIN